MNAKNKCGRIGQAQSLRKRRGSSFLQLRPKDTPVLMALLEGRALSTSRLWLLVIRRGFGDAVGAMEGGVFWARGEPTRRRVVCDQIISPQQRLDKSRVRPTKAACSR